MKHVVLLGMGGSSLAPEVFQETFGNAPGYPKLRVLDSTHPAAVKAVEREIDLEAGHGDDSSVSRHAPSSNHRVIKTTEAHHPAAAPNRAGPRTRRRALTGRSWGPIQAYFRLTPAQRLALAGGEEIWLSTGPGPEDRRLPSEMRRPLLELSNFGLSSFEGRPMILPRSRLRYSPFAG